MVRLVLRRAWAQGRLLAGVVALVVLGTTLLGVGALLLTETQDRAFTQAVDRAATPDLDVTAYLVDVGPDVARTREEAAAVVEQLLAPLGSTVGGTVVARMRRLAGGAGLAYLASEEAFARPTLLTSGRLPAAGTARADDVVAEALVPDAAAGRLGLTVGDRVTLGGETGQGAVQTPVTVVVVGTYRPRSLADWQADPLSGAGHDPAFSDGYVRSAAYGPFLVGKDALLASGSTVDSMQVTARPDRAAASDAALGAVTGALDRGGRLLSARVGDGARRSRVTSDLPLVLQRIRAQQAATRSTVAVVLLLGTALSATALLLAGRLLDGSRYAERALLVGLGLGRRQLLVATGGEALVIAAVATLLAVPGAAVVHAGLTRLPALSEAGLTQGPAVTPALLLTSLAGAVVLTLALVLPVLGSRAGPRALLGRGAAVARAVGGVLLLAVAVAARQQVRSAPSSQTALDLTRTVAPVMCVLAVAVVAVRAVPVLLALAARAAGRSRTLLLPLALSQAARRDQAVAALVLVSVAVGSATLAVSVHSTWHRSQDDQAALRVGTDLALALTAPTTAENAAAVHSATAADPVVSAVVDRPLALGRYLGEDGDPPVLVAVDTRRAGALLRGRLAGEGSWTAVGVELAPGPRVVGLPLPAGGAGVEVAGTAPDGVGVVATPALVLQDAAGFRSSVAVDPVPLDGRARAVRWPGPLGAGQSLVAVRIALTEGPGADADSAQGDADVSVALTVPGPAPAAPDWQALVLQARASSALGATVTVEPAGDTAGAVVRTSTSLDLSELADEDGELLATAYAPPADIPVAVSQELVAAVGARVGSTLAGTVAGVEVALRVTAVVPAVPSVPGRIAVLADTDTLSRALIGAGALDPVVDGWWVAGPDPGTVEGLRALDLGEVTTRHEVATRLTRGPLQVMVPAALVVLPVAAAALLFAGVGLVLGTDGRRRSVEVAQLRALGLTRRRARRLLLAEHAALLVPLVLLGTLLGGAAALALGPGLIRSDAGRAPVPAVVVVWPWAVEAGLVGGLLVGCLVVGLVVTRAQVRRSDTARLGSGDG